ESLLARKGAGKEARLCYSAHALMENRNTILIDFQVEPADGRAERRAAIAMVGECLPGSQRTTLGGDKGYDTRDFVESCRALKVTPHVAQNLARPGGSAISARTVRHPVYAVSQWIRKRVEETFGWMKTIGGLRRTRYCGRPLVQMHAARHGRPDIFNTDQGSQFTSTSFTDVLLKAGIAISMDGKGSWRDNVFVERLWRSVKYEEVYLKAYDSVAEARSAIGGYFGFYNTRRPHSSLQRRTPDQAYFNWLPQIAAA